MISITETGVNDRRKKFGSVFVNLWNTKNFTERPLGAKIGWQFSTSLKQKQTL